MRGQVITLRVIERRDAVVASGIRGIGVFESFNLLSRAGKREHRGE